MEGVVVVVGAVPVVVVVFVAIVAHGNKVYICPTYQFSLLQNIVPKHSIGHMCIGTFHEGYQ